MDFISEHPGRLYVIATLLPLASFVVLLLLGAIRNAARPYSKSGIGQSIFWMAGGDIPTKVGAYVATAAIAISCILCLAGLVAFLSTHPLSEHHEHVSAEAEKAGDPHEDKHDHGEKWAERITFLSVGSHKPGYRPAIQIELGYHIDHLSAVMFAMVTFIATLIHLFSAGYMADELNVRLEDHQVHGDDGGHLRRRGRYSRFFMYLSLFCFSMLNLVLADNLFQIFVSWELVGICSFLLIGFYYERQSASNAANKAFITNRVGDAGFVIGLLVLWTSVGTFNFQDIFAQVRAPLNSHGQAEGVSNEIVRVKSIEADKTSERLQIDRAGDDVLLFPDPRTLGEKPHFHIPSDNAIVRINAPESWYKERDSRLRYRTMPYILLTIAGLGIFLGCVGKSAQFPLHVWLPDAMEGPTPVSALIHAATMVAAGVYLVGRVFPLFTPEARLVIAYTGAITLFVAATIAIVMTDIKKVLAYSTVSQLGYMMLALGIGGWVAGLLHLLTHAFFKALLFLGSGSVIHGCHHEQDMRKMGGLRAKLPITAATMLVGVLAIAGTPLFSGWYSKDAIIAQGYAFVSVFRQHLPLLILPLLTAGITTFYMFRMWFMTFTGEPRDHHVYDHAHESPRLMTIPLILLAVLSLCVAWGWPVWSPHDSFLHKVLHESQPASVAKDMPAVSELVNDHHSWVHAAAGPTALLAAVLGGLFAFLVYYYRTLDAEETKEKFGFLYRLFDRKWYFDELYSALLVRPALVVAHWCRTADARGLDGVINGIGSGAVRVARGGGSFDRGIIDGTVNTIAGATSRLGTRLRQIQTGSLRSYIVFLVLAAIGVFAILSYFLNLASARP